MNPPTQQIRARARSEDRMLESIRGHANPSETLTEMGQAPPLPAEGKSTSAEEKAASPEAVKPSSVSTSLVAKTLTSSVAGDSEAESKNETKGGGDDGGGMLLLGYHALNSLDGDDIPEYVKEHNATLSFPEKLMLMLMYVEREYAKSGRKPSDAPVAWMPDGNSFLIRSKETLVRDLLPLFFRQSKFSSFTRKLYRWGFRQVNIPRERLPNEIYFGNEAFQRDDKAKLSEMRSITAAGLRREKAAETARQRDQAVSNARAEATNELPGLSELLMPGMRLPVHPPGMQLSALPGFRSPLMPDAGQFHQQSAVHSAMIQQALANAQLQRQLAIQQASRQQNLLALSQVSVRSSVAGLRLGANLGGSVANLPSLSAMQLTQLGLPSALRPAVGYPSSLGLQNAVAERERLQSAVGMLLRSPQPSPPPPPPPP